MIHGVAHRRRSRYPPASRRDSSRDRVESTGDREHRQRQHDRDEVTHRGHTLSPGGGGRRLRYHACMYAPPPMTAMTAAMTANHTTTSTMGDTICRVYVTS